MPSRVAHLFLKPGHGVPMEPRQQLEAVEAQGLTGDAAFGSRRRQVLLIDSETLEHFSLAPGTVRENITTEGLPLPGMREGTRLRIDKAILEVTVDCTPCDFLDRLRPGLRRAINGRRGLLARVERSGTIRVGSTIEVLAETEEKADA